MTDCFALLGEPRRPWLDPDALKEKFHKLGAAHHPDVAKTNDVDFSAINAAYVTLLDPKSRIRHLLELEFPDAPARDLQAPPPDILAIFETVARERREATDFFKKRATLQSPLEIALAAPEKVRVQDVLDGLQSILRSKLQEGFLKTFEICRCLVGQRQSRGIEPALLNGNPQQAFPSAGKYLARCRRI